MKRLITVSLAFAMAVVVAFSSAAPAKVSAQAKLKIGLVTDVGRVDDKGFNQSSWEGAQKAAKEVGADAEYIETADPTDYANNIKTLVDKGNNVIITVGFALGDATIKAAKNNPKVTFIAVDTFIDTKDTPNMNVIGLIFPEDNSGFLAGVLAARLSKSGKVAGVYGTDQVPPVVRFKEGFEAGAKFANAKIDVKSTYYPGGIDKAFNDPAWGATTAGQALDQGADVIFGAGGNTGNGALQEVAKRTTKDKPLFCIGVDTDQWLTLTEAHPCLVSSATKNIPDGIVSIVKDIKDGKAKSGLFSGKVELAPFHDFDKTVSDDIKKELADLKAQLEAGTLTSKGEKKAAATMAATAPAMAATMAATMAPTASK
jgi:basic membrane protein A